MNQNPTRTLWISIGMGIFAMFLIYSYSQEKKAEYDHRYGTSKRVLVASKDILEMSTIDDTMIETQELPVDFVQPGAITEPDLVINKVAATPIKKGTQILGTNLMSLGANTGLSNQVAPGKRAVSIPVDDTRGVSKLLQPGDRIDILASVEVGSGANKSVEVRTIMQDVVVLATGLKITNNIPRLLEKNPYSSEAVFRNLNGDTSFSAISIEATPQEAQNLVYMMSTSPGSLFVTLRNPNDRITNTLGNVGVSSVIGQMASPIYRPMNPSMQNTIPVQQLRKPASMQKRKSPFVEVR